MVSALRIVAEVWMRPVTENCRLLQERCKLEGEMEKIEPIPTRGRPNPGCTGEGIQLCVSVQQCEGDIAASAKQLCLSDLRELIDKTRLDYYYSPPPNVRRANASALETLTLVHTVDLSVPRVPAMLNKVHGRVKSMLAKADYFNAGIGIQRYTPSPGGPDARRRGSELVPFLRSVGQVGLADFLEKHPNRIAALSQSIFLAGVPDAKGIVVVYIPEEWVWRNKTSLLEFSSMRFNDEYPDGFSAFDSGAFKVLYLDEGEEEKKGEKNQPIHHYCEHLPHIRWYGGFGVPCGGGFAESKKEGAQAPMGTKTFETTGHTNFFHSKTQNRGDLVSSECFQCQEWARV